MQLKSMMQTGGTFSIDDINPDIMKETIALLREK
jgi:hypothetical protein